MERLLKKGVGKESRVDKDGLLAGRISAMTSRPNPWSRANR
jgi:hypothetical protein